MKQVGVVILSLLVTIQAMPLSLRRVAEQQEILLPDARAGEVYRTDIESVLRDQYRLKIDTDTSESILQWFVMDGEVPPGISLRSNGVLTGTPTVRREQSYHFRLKVVDVASRNTEPLVIDFSLRVNGAQIRLTKIKSVALVPIDGSTSQERSTGPNNRSDEEMDTALTLQTESLVTTPGNSLTQEKSGNGLSSEKKLPTTVATNISSIASTLHFDMAATKQAPDCKSPTKSGNAFSNLFSRPVKNGKKCLVIDTVPPPTEVPEPLEVSNGTVVTVSGTKSPVNKCAVETKREELAPEANPFAQFLKLIVALGPIAVAGAEEKKPEEDTLCRGPKDIPVPEDSEAKQIEEIEVVSIRRSLLRTYGALSAFATRYQSVGENSGAFISCADPSICRDETQFETEKKKLQERLMELLELKDEKLIPSLESTELQISSLRKALTSRYRRPGGPKEEAWIDAVNKRLDCFTKYLTVLKAQRELLVTAKGEFATLLDALNAHQTVFDYKKVLIADANAKVTGSVTCTNFFTKQPAIDPIPFTITYLNFPRASVTAGVLFTLLDKREIGTQPIRTGTAADGTPTFRVAFSETDRGSSQVVPFSFFNYYLSGTRALNLNLSGGVGVNPNNGSTQVEYFFGGALGHKNVFFQFGGHVGRWQELGNDFNLGETVPNNFPSVPITRRYSVRPGFGISYRLPLP